MKNDHQNIEEMLSFQNQQNIAFQESGKKPLTYKELLIHVKKISKLIKNFKINKNDRIAIVLPNGSIAASAFICVSSCAVSAPLNPNYKKDEFQFYMSDLNVRLLICVETEKDAVLAAKNLSIPIVFLKINEFDSAGIFHIETQNDFEIDIDQINQNDEALVLHTSGTTSRPKIVPLSNKNIMSSAKNISQTLKLTSDDVCINIMPLFHIHGLIAVVLSSLFSGGSVFFTSGFNALGFFSSLEEAEASWFSAVPTMHQAILNRASKNLKIIQNSNLRFIRSSSSSLPPKTMIDLEKTFNCPVVEAYGMTEASHQMTSNSITRGSQVPGSVGIEAGPEVRVFSDENLTSKPNVLGEIVINGDNVFEGYESNDKANKDSFIKDNENKKLWFRTGDQGKFDKNGLLFITGRLKEIINRGGEKISPREVDEILMDHPHVDQAITFSIPHKSLGEDIAAVLVAKEGSDININEIRDFASEKLSNYKIPRKILIREEIPKGSTGKVQRIGLARKLGISNE